VRGRNRNAAYCSFPHRNNVVQAHLFTASWERRGQPFLPPNIRGPYPSTSILAESFAMTNTIAAPPTPTHGEAAIREFANSNLTLEQSRQRAPVLLNDKQLLQNIPGLTPEEQTNFVEKVDQVCRVVTQPYSFLKISLHLSPQGVSYYRLPQHKIRNSLGERVQCDQTTPNFSCTLHRARETWQYCCSVRRVHGRLAGRPPWRTGSYQSLSHIFRPKFEGGKGSKHTVTIGGLLSNEIYRFCGNGCRRGGDYPIKTSYPFAVST